MVDTRVSEERVAELKAQWGLDKPAIVQYFYWLGNILQGDFGMSVSMKQNVGDLIMQRLPYTLMLTGAALLIEYLIAIPLGLLAAVKKDRLTDKALTVGTIVLWSMPQFWLGVLLMFIFSITLGVLPLSGYSGFASLILPAFTPGAADAGADIQADSFRSAGRHARKIRDDGQRQRIKQQKGTDKTHPEKCSDTCHSDVFPLSAVAHRRRRSRGKRICMAGNGAAALESNFKAGFHGGAGNNLCYNNFDSNL